MVYLLFFFLGGGDLISILLLSKVKFTRSIEYEVKLRLKKTTPLHDLQRNYKQQVSKQPKIGIFQISMYGAKILIPKLFGNHMSG